MKKFTRKHYNKKLVALGLSAFMGIGLVSTGFAAWVMSKDASEAPEGNVNVAIITDSSLKIILNAETASYDDSSKIWTLKDEFSFDAKKDDVSGRLRFGGDGNGEDLSIAFSGYLEGDGAVKYDMTAQVELPAGVAAAIDAGYIAWKDGVDYEHTAQPVALDDDNKFTLTLEFVWGNQFGGMNPCEYYDTEGKGKEISEADMQSQLEEFRKTITGVDASIGDDMENYTGKFKVTLSATPAPVDGE